ncbi:hypothetical protein SAMN05444359_11849 [Neolewinella agarilytica]|uniref:Phosphate-selective porin O and P n=2 Tax=Neolewinella agarilytica TaxID=478744 RepID=A0A1H9JSX8_9BACT|nr:hypothetical protein SAMN05444359_11849 [Neolewinella agarilytica]
MITSAPLRVSPSPLRSSFSPIHNLLSLPTPYFAAMKQDLIRPFLLFFLFSGLSVLTAQTEKDSPTSFKNWEIKPILGVQLWSTYTMGHQDYVPESDTYVDASDRLNFLVRRMRFGSTAKIGDRLFLKFLGAADWIGEDQRSGPPGGVNNGAFPNAQIWDIFAQYKLSPKSEALYVIGGYLRPPVGRESMSGALGTSSMEKGFNQWYMRQHLTGTGPGGAGGVYLGGLSSLSEKIHVDYRAGVFNPQNNGITGGRTSSSLLVSRLNFMFGDPEKETWTYGLPAANSFGKRRTVALALNLANEGPTGAAPEGTSLLGVDGLINLGHFHLEGEYHRMIRKSSEPDLESATWMIRTGVNIDVSPAGADVPRYLEPSLMFYGFDGTTDIEDYPAVLATNYFGGRETIINAGVNYHLVPGKVRIGLHYTAISGDRGDLPADGQLSHYFSQPGVGGIQRGDYAGFELILNY